MHFTFDQSSTVQVECALAHCNLFFIIDGVSSGFFSGRHARSPASNSRLRTVLQLVVVPLWDQSIASCLDVALRLDRQKLTSLLSSLALDRRRLPHFPRRLGDNGRPDFRLFEITFTTCGETISFLAISFCVKDVSSRRTRICPFFLGLRSDLLPIPSLRKFTE